MNVQETLAELARMGSAPVGQRIERPRVCAEAGCSSPAALSEGAKGVPMAFCVTHARAEVQRRHAEASAARYGRIPEGVRDVRFASPKLTMRVAAPSIALAREALASDGPDVVLLFAPAGTGKTLLAAAMANAVLDAATPGAPRERHERARKFRWVTAMDLGSARRDASLGAEPVIIAEAIGASFLVLEELGKETGDDGMQNVWEVVYERHARQRPTVITCGLRWEAIVSRYDQGMVRRLGEKPQSLAIPVARGGK